MFQCRTSPLDLFSQGFGRQTQFLFAQDRGGGNAARTPLPCALVVMMAAAWQWQPVEDGGGQAVASCGVAGNMYGTASKVEWLADMNPH